MPVAVEPRFGVFASRCLDGASLLEADCFTSDCLGAETSI